MVRIRELVPPAVTEKRMFGGLAFLLSGNMALAASGQGGLLVRVDPEQAARLLTEHGVAAFEMGRGPVKGWLRVDGPVLADDAALARWVHRGLGYAGTLPPK